ncbi:MAG: cysteine--tRNA ligase [Nanoarchaeota archaeon]
MVLRIYNTLSRKKEIFKPLKGKKINLFVCGITPYDYPHIGHTKTYTQFDFIVKYLRYKGYNVFYLQNITDLDDKIIQRAGELNITSKELSRKFEKIYLENMEKLHNDSVTKYVRATDYINAIVKQVNTLIKNGYAYKINDGWYFDISKDKEYGKLSGRNIEQAEDAISRIDKSKEKRNKGDFCLWKFSKLGEPSWETEIGKGKPGWHIEDTAITETFFGPQYDIHGGAVDLVFPHHEAEIAQMESASGKKPLVKYWMHTGFLNVKGQKMSKSLGNFITISDILKRYDYKLIRYFFLSSHYRSPIDFSDELLEQSKNSLQRLNDFLSNCKDKPINKNNKKFVEETKNKFFESLDDDFDTPKAFAVLFDFIREANKKGPDKNYYKLLLEINEIFDIFDVKEPKLSKEIKDLIKKREKARKEGNFKEADKIRGILKNKGILLEDTPKGIKHKTIK